MHSIAESAHAAGKSVGLVTDTRITHATHAAFGAHQLHRSLENAIAVDLIESGFEVLLGGGMRHLVPANPENTPAINELASAEPSARAMLRRSKRTDERNILSDAQALGYQLIFDRNQLTATEATKVLGVFAESGMADGIEVRRSHSLSKRDDTLVVVASGVQAERFNGVFHTTELGKFLQEVFNLPTED